MMMEVEDTYEATYPEYTDYLQSATCMQMTHQNAQEKKVAFPTLLHRMLDSVNDVGLGNVIQWLPHGRAFRVCDKPKFVSLVLLHYFQQKSYASFQRQLNNYGFTRLTKIGPDKSAYYHELFLRGRPDLSFFLALKQKDGDIRSVRKSLDPSTEPDFYRLPWAFGQASFAEQKVQAPSESTESTSSRSAVSRAHLARAVEPGAHLASLSSDADGTRNVERKWHDSLPPKRMKSTGSFHAFDTTVTESSLKLSCNPCHELPLPQDNVPRLPFPGEVIEHLAPASRISVVDSDGPNLCKQEKASTLLGSNAEERRSLSLFRRHRRELANTESTALRACDAVTESTSNGEIEENDRLMNELFFGLFTGEPAATSKRRQHR